MPFKPPILYNGKILSTEKMQIDLASDWIKFAPGFFETMKVSNDIIFFWEDHYRRLKMGAQYWQIEIPSKMKLLKKLSDLISTSKLNQARLKLQFIVSIPDAQFQYVGTIMPLVYNEYTWNEKGYKLGLYENKFLLRDNSKSFKSNDRSIYLQAEDWGRQYNFDEVMVMNSNKEITDTTRCCIFYIKNGMIYSPPVNAGGVESTFCRFLFKNRKEWDIQLKRKKTKIKDLKKADEIFVANVVRGIQWVEYFGDTKYSNKLTMQLFKRLQKWESELNQSILQ